MFTGIVEEVGTIKSINRGPVSYTHLDVYKRQLQVGLIFAQPGAERVPEIMAGERRQQLRFQMCIRDSVYHGKTEKIKNGPLHQTR